MITITCKQCQAILTNTLKEIVLDLGLFQEGEEIIERGHFCNGHGDPSISHEDRILINVRDSKLLDHKTLLNYFGCCGQEPTDFLNQTCPNCGLGVATIVTECYTYHYLAFQKNQVLIETVYTSL
jgi:hypothetical protein